VDFTSSTNHWCPSASLSVVPCVMQVIRAMRAVVGVEWVTYYPCYGDRTSAYHPLRGFVLLHFFRRGSKSPSQLVHWDAVVGRGVIQYRAVDSQLSPALRAAMDSAAATATSLRDSQRSRRLGATFPTGTTCACVVGVIIVLSKCCSVRRRLSVCAFNAALTNTTCHRFAAQSCCHLAAAASTTVSWVSGPPPPSMICTTSASVALSWVPTSVESTRVPMSRCEVHYLCFMCCAAFCRRRRRFLVLPPDSVHEMLMEGERGRAMAVEDRAAAALLRHVNWLAVAVALGRTLVVAPGPSFNATRYAATRSCRFTIIASDVHDGVAGIDRNVTTFKVGSHTRDVVCTRRTSMLHGGRDVVVQRPPDGVP
jgi:hypothetical protein